MKKSIEEEKLEKINQTLEKISDLEFSINLNHKDIRSAEWNINLEKRTINDKEKENKILEEKIKKLKLTLSKK